ncbi:MAG: carotenoid biosynthesis protein [Bacteroidetes bacterium]|nr:carotenoid biosynthesis protein [Bacteroidota bacterium]
MQEQKNKRVLVSSLALVIVHLAGIIGINSMYRELFLSLTPFNLLLSAGLLLYNHKGFNRAFLMFMLSVLLGGFLIEAAGVYSGLIFGAYWYGPALGWQLLSVPVVIGVNWLMLVYCAGTISGKLKANLVLKSAAGAALLVALDALIEQSAPTYGFWSWLNGIIPLRNYIAWFIVSFAFLCLFHSLNFHKQNRLAPVLYIIQLVFFTLLLACKP